MNDERQPPKDGEESWVEKVEHLVEEEVKHRLEQVEHGLEEVEHFVEEELVEPVKRRTPLWLRRTLLIIFWVLAAQVALFQLPWVQNWAAHKTAAYLSKELHTTVSIRKAYFGIFNKVILHDFYLQDLAGDTLIYAGELRVDHSGLYMLPFRQLKVETFSLKNADVHIGRQAGQEQSNFKFVLDYFVRQEDPAKQLQPGESFRLNLRHFYLDRVHFLQPDAVLGETRDIFVNHAEGHFNRFDLLEKRFDLASLTLEQPDVKLSMYPEQPFPLRFPPGMTRGGEPVQAPVPVVYDTAKLVVTIEDFNLEGGRFSLKNTRNGRKPDEQRNGVNFNDLQAEDIEVRIKGFTFSELEFFGEVEKIALRERSGFVLENLSADSAALTCSGLALFGLNLKTPYSELGDTLVFKYRGSYRAWENFTDEVRMELRLHDASVALRDIMAFAPALERNPFFKENENEVFQLDGLVKGEVNQLDGKNLKVNLAQGLALQGSFSTRGLAVPDEQFLYLKLDWLRTDVRTLRKLIPKFKPPENFDRLGSLNFSGKFNGFFDDFVADGTLNSDIGSATMFMNLKLREGRERARYSGDLFLKNFDLGKWANDPNLGKITLDSHVKEGVGLTLPSASARLEAKVDSFQFKGYQYKNVVFNGRLRKNLFDGDLTVSDKNIDLDFRGSVNLTDSLPAFNFKADLRSLALEPLHLSKNDLRFFGKVDMNLRGKRLSNIVGEAQLADFVLVKNQKDTLVVDAATVVSTLSPAGEKHFAVQSSLGTVDIRGRFDIEQIPNRFLSFLTGNYPRFAQRIGIQPPALPFPKGTSDTARFDFDVALFEVQELLGFLNEKVGGFDSTTVAGTYDGFANRLEAEVEVPAWRFQNIEFNGVFFRTKLDGEEGGIQVGVIETKLGDGQTLSPVSFNADLYRDTLEFVVISTNFYNILDNLNLNGVLTLDADNAWRVRFKQSNLVILSQIWDINTDNYLVIGEGRVETENFILTHGGQQIVLKNVRDEGLELQLKNFPLDSIEPVQRLKTQKIQGTADLVLRAKDVFRVQGLSALLRVDSLTVNGDNYGTLRLDASAPSIAETVSGFLAIENGDMELTVDGFFNPPTYKGEPNRKWLKNDPLYFDFDLSFSNYPARILKYFVAEVSDVQGTASAPSIRAWGLPSKPDISGEVFIKDAAFTLNALQTRYRVPEAKVKVGSRLFDATGAVALDRLGNQATVEGGITHDHLKNFGLDVRITTAPGRRFLAMETTAKNNPVFHGTAFGSGYARFTGTFKQPSLQVVGRSMHGTSITIPIGNAANTKRVSFINFTADSLRQGGTPKPPPRQELRGLNMEFDLELTESAAMEMIFDKAWGDVLRGTGTGNLKVIITREGRFDMFGEYEVASGDYLFTLMNIGFNKPFKIAPGGTVTWTGDPFNAIIDISAVYQGLNTSIYNFIGEFVASSPDLQNLARNPTQIDLKMRLKGSLLHPDIEFDIDFPGLDSELRNYAESKLRTLRQDPNELNRQVFGLLVLGQFLPSGYSFQAGDVGINTLSEMLANQLSIYLTEFVSELFTGSGIIQGIDLDINYNRFSTGGVDDPSTYTTGSELQGKLKVILSDRFSVRVGGNFDVGGSSGGPVTSNSTFRGHEFVVEYVVSKDRRLSVKAYNSTEPDIGGGRRNRIGAGLSFRKEFDSLDELVSFRRKKNKG